MSSVGKISLEIDANAAGFHRGMDGVQQKLGQIGQGMKQFGASMTRYVTLPLLAVGTAAFKMGKDFEFEMQKIVGLVGISRDQVDDWGRAILEMAPALGKAPKELAEALYFITSAGISGSEALDVLEMSAKASAVGLGETKVVADLVTSAMNAYGSEVLSAADATNVLLKAVRLGKAAPEELAAAMGAVLPIASEMGVSFDQLAGAIAAMSRTGTDANTATTQLKQILVSLLKPAAQAEKALNDMGTSSAELRKQIQDEGLLVVLMRLKDLTGEYGEEIMARVFPNIRALMGILDLMGANMEDNIAIMNEMGITTDELSKAFEGVSDTAEFKFQAAMAQLQVSLIELWKVMEGPVISILGDVVTKIEAVTESFKNLDSAQQEQIIKWAGLVIAIGPVSSILGNLAMFSAFVLIPALKGVSAAITATGVAATGATGGLAVFGAGLMILLGKIALVAAAIVALIELIRGFNRLQVQSPIMPGYDSSKGLGTQNIPKYDTGGIVSGPRGRPQLAVVHGGEIVLPAHKPGWAINPLELTQVEKDANNVSIDMKGLFDGANISIGSERDAKALAREIHSLIQSRARGEGVLLGV